MSTSISTTRTAPRSPGGRRSPRPSASVSRPRSTSAPRRRPTSTRSTSSASAAATPARCWRHRPTAVASASSRRARRRARVDGRDRDRARRRRRLAPPCPRRHQRRRRARSRVSKAVAGAPALRGVIGGSNDHRPLNRAVMGVLWPALWGHSLATSGDSRPKRTSSASGPPQNLVPEGPLPSVRIDDPAVRAAAGDLAAPVEGGKPATRRSRRASCRSYAALVATWAAAAERQAAQQQGDVLRGLVRNPTASRYAWHG